jgi:uncharacterized protein (TIRG00374 family)
LSQSLEKKPSKLNFIWRWVPGFLMSLIAILALFKFVPIDKAINVLRNVPITYYLISALFTLLFLLVRTIGWRALLGFRPDYKDTFFKLSLGYFINNIFPFRLGEISRAIFMGASIKVHPGQILSTIFIERIFDLIILAFFLLLMLPYVVGMAWIKTTAWVILGVLIVGLFVLFMFLRNSSKVDKFLENIGNKKNVILRFVIPLIRSLFEGFQSLKNPKQALIGFGGVLGSWLVSFVQFSIFLSLFTKNSEWWWGIFANCILALGIALPSAPAGLGIYESSIVAGLKLFNIEESISLAFGLMLHISQFILIAILGLFALSRDGYSLKKLFSQLIQFKEQLNNEKKSGESNE